MVQFESMIKFSVSTMEFNDLARSDTSQLILFISCAEIPLEIYFSRAVWNDGNRRVRVRTPGLHPLHFCHIDRYVDVEAGSVYR